MVLFKIQASLDSRRNRRPIFRPYLSAKRQPATFLSDLLLLVWCPCDASRPMSVRSRGALNRSTPNNEVKGHIGILHCSSAVAPYIYIPRTRRNPSSIGAFKRRDNNGTKSNDPHPCDGAKRSMAHMWDQ